MIAPAPSPTPGELEQWCRRTRAKARAERTLYLHRAMMSADHCDVCGAPAPCDEVLDAGDVLALIDEIDRVRQALAGSRWRR